MNNSLDDLPRDSDELAAIVQDPNESQGRKSCAWEKLAPVIHEVAERLAANRFPERYSDELLSGATSILWDRLRQNKFNAERGRFAAFARTVLHNAFCDVLRREFVSEGRGDTSDDDDQAAMSDPADEDDWHDDRERWFAQRQQLRAVLDRISSSWKPTSPRSVHYYIVLLLALRKGICALVADWPNAGNDEDCELSDFVQWILHWHDWESEERFVESLARLGTVWSALRTKVDHPAHRFDSRDVADAIGTNSSPGVTISPSRWDQWARRAKRQARERVGDAEWDHLFARLLPDRSRSTPSTRMNRENAL